MIDVERTDFVSVPVRDMARARQFYSGTLGLPSPNLDDGWPEFETGNVSLYLLNPAAIGAELAPRMAFFTDPDGNALMHRRYAPSEERSA